MPIRRARIQLVLEVSHARIGGVFAALALGTLVLAGCGGDASPSKPPAITVSTLGSTAVPQVRLEYFDAVIFFCPSTAYATPCTAPTTAGQIAAVRDRLHADPDVRESVFVSAEKAYELGKTLLSGLETSLAEPGDFPAAFAVRLTDPSRLGAFEDRYRSLPGVSGAGRCVGQRACKLDDLRAVGVVH